VAKASQAGCLSYGKTKNLAREKATQAGCLSYGKITKKKPVPFGYWLVKIYWVNVY